MIYRIGGPAYCKNCLLVIKRGGDLTMMQITKYEYRLNINSFCRSQIVVPPGPIKEEGEERSLRS